MKEQNEEELKQNGSEIQEETSAHSDNADKMAEQEQQTEAEVKADETQPETAPEKEKTTEEKLQEAEEEIASLKDQLLRKIAEFDNYRKRTIKEKTELILNGGEKTVVAILPVLDDMERALTNMEQAGDVKAVVEGVKPIPTKF